MRANTDTYFVITSVYLFDYKNKRVLGRSFIERIINFTFTGLSNPFELKDKHFEKMQKELANTIITAILE
jgi:hypothetical protein